MINTLLFLLLSLGVGAKIDLELISSATQVKQGSLVDVIIRLEQSGPDQGMPHGLKGKTIGQTLYVHELKPFLGKSGQSFFEAPAKVIFIKVPEVNSLKEVINEREIELGLGGITVIPTETPQNFLLGDFDIPKVMRVLPMVLIFIILVLVIGSILYLRQKLLKQKQEKNRIRNLKEDLLKGKSYEDIVLIWSRKREFIKEFPGLENLFTDFEGILFKYQFKPSRNENEINEVLSAYKAFSNKAEGVLNGV